MPQPVVRASYQVRTGEAILKRYAVPFWLAGMLGVNLSAAQGFAPFDDARHRFGVASESQTGCPVPSGRKENGKEVTHSLPFSMYTAPGGLRQGRGRAAQSTVRGQNPTDGSGELMEGHAVVIAGGGPTGPVLAGEHPFARGR